MAVSKTDCRGGESGRAAGVAFAARQRPQHINCDGRSTDNVKTKDSPALLHWRLSQLHQVDWDIPQYNIWCHGKDDTGDGVR